MLKRMAGLGLALTVALTWSAAGLAGDAAAPAPKPVARPAGVPAEAAFWMIVPSPKASLERLKKLAEAFQPGTGAMAELGIRQASPWSFAEADEAKPIVAVFQLPKEAGADPSWAVAGSLKAGTDGAAVLEKRFGGKPARTEDGVSVFLQVQEGALPDKEIFAAAKDGRLVLGDSKALIRSLANCPAPADGAFPAGADILAGVDVTVLATQYKDKIEAGLKDLEEGAANAAAMMPGAGANAQGMVVGAKVLADKCRVGLKEVAQAGVRIGLGDTISITWTLQAIPGTSFAAELAKMEKLGLPPVGLLHEQGTVAMALSLPPEYAQSFVEFLNPVVRAGLTIEEADQEKLKALDAEATKFTTALSALAKQFDGRMAMSLGKGAGAGALGFLAVKDPAAARAAMTTIGKLSQDGPFAEVMRKQGQKQTFATNVRQNGGVEIDRITTEMVGGNPDVPAELAEFQKKFAVVLYGESPITQELACAKDRMLMAAGKGSAAALDELLARASGAKPGTAAMAETYKNAPKGSFAAGELYLLDCTGLLMKAAGEAGGMMAMFKLDLPKEADKSPVTGYLFAAGGELGAEMRIPVDPIRKLAEAFRKMQQDMMGGGAAVPLPVE